MVAKLLDKGSKIFNSQQHTVLSAAFVIAVVYSLTALLGFIRNRLLSSFYGDSPELGIFFAADDIPTIIFSIIVSGSLSVSFIPVFTKYYKKNKEYAWEFTSSFINISFILLLISLIIVFGGSEFIVKNTIARNSSLTVEELALLADLTKIMMIAQIAFIFSSFYTSILQSFKTFILPAMAPVMLNAGMIVFLVLFYDRFGIYAPAYGTIFGALLHLAIQVPAATKFGFNHKAVFDYKNKAVLEVYKLMIPRTFTQVAQKLLIPFYTNLALFISAPSNVILTFADDLQAIPLRIFGMSIGQAALPMLSSAYEENDMSKFKKLLTRTLYQVLYFVMPMAVVMFLLRVPLVRISVGASKYSWEATVMTGYTLGFFSISIVFQAIILILSRAYYALCDTKTPLKISLVIVASNALLAYYFVKILDWGVWSLAFAFSISSIVYAFLLFVYLLPRLGKFDLIKFLGPVNKIGIATIITGISLYIPMKILEALIFDTTRTIDLLILTGIVTLIAMITYFFLTYKLKVREAKELLSFVKAKMLLIKRSSI